MNILPYAYTLLVFSIVAFLFVLLGRIFLNVVTTYEYDFHRLIKDNSNPSNVYLNEITNLINKKGSEGWKFERIEEVNNLGNGSIVNILIFSKTRNKIKLF